MVVDPFGTAEAAGLEVMMMGLLLLLLMLLLLWIQGEGGWFLGLAQAQTLQERFG